MSVFAEDPHGTSIPPEDPGDTVTTSVTLNRADRARLEAIGRERYGIDGLSPMLRMAVKEFNARHDAPTSATDPVAA